MLSKILNALLVLLVVGFVINYIYRLPRFDDGEQAPTFQATLIDGSSFDLADMKGQYVLLDFWGSWCAPCRRENPDIVQLQSKYAGQQFEDATGFEVVSIAIETSEARWKNAIVKDGLSWKYHIAQLDRFDSPVAQLYGVKEIPTKYLVGPNGDILSVNASPAEITRYLASKRK